LLRKGKIIEIITIVLMQMETYTSVINKQPNDAHTKKYKTRTIQTKIKDKRNNKE
jgi:hypothetical protein